MLISELSLPKWLKVPKRVSERATDQVEIQVHPFQKDELLQELPLGGAKSIEWISCKRATPHIDDHMCGDYFVTISMVDYYQFGDVKAYSDADYFLRKGSMFVVDPRIKHWLFHENDYFEKCPRTPWVGLQWIVPRRRIVSTLKVLMDFFDGIPENNSDPRVKSWLKKLKAARASRLS